MVREWAQEKARALAPGLVEEKGPDLGQASVRELSTPARAWLLLWQWLLLW